MENQNETQIPQEILSVDGVLKQTLKKTALVFTVLGVVSGVPVFLGIIMATVSAVGGCNTDLPHIYTMLSSIAIYGFPVFLILSIIGVWFAALKLQSKKVLIGFGVLPLASIVFSLLAVMSLSLGSGCYKEPVSPPKMVHAVQDIGVGGWSDTVCYVRDLQHFTTVYALPQPRPGSDFNYEGDGFGRIELPADAIEVVGGAAQDFTDLSDIRFINGVNVCLGKSSKYVYYGAHVIEGADPSSFKYLSGAGSELDPILFQSGSSTYKLMPGDSKGTSSVTPLFVR